MPAARNSNGAYRLFALPSGLLIFLLSLGVTALAAYEANRQLNFRDAINDYLDNNVRSEYTVSIGIAGREPRCDADRRMARCFFFWTDRFTTTISSTN